MGSDDKQVIAEVEMPPMGTHHTSLGIHSFGRLEYESRDGEIVYEDEGPVRVLVPERHVRGAAG